MKNCTLCKKTKELSEFNKNRSHSTGLDSWCRPCKSSYYSDWQKRNRKLCSEKQKRWRHSNPLKTKNKQLRESFGISLEIYNNLLKSQGGVCAICGAKESSTHNGKIRHLSVDHCHESGTIRGLLCNGCNVSIGRMNDNPFRLIAAAEYLWKFRRKTA